MGKDKDYAQAGPGAKHDSPTVTLADAEELAACYGGGWTQTVIPSPAEQQRQLDWERAIDPCHDMEGAGYTEPPLDGEPEPSDHGKDWRALREADACARARGLRVGLPSTARWSPECQADADAWGSGRGVDAELEREA